MGGQLTAAAVDHVAVGGGDAGVDNGVEAGKGGARVAGHAPEGICRAGEEGDGGRGSDGLHGGGGGGMEGAAWAEYVLVGLRACCVFSRREQIWTGRSVCVCAWQRAWWLQKSDTGKRMSD